MFTQTLLIFLGLVGCSNGGSVSASPKYTWPLNGVFRGIETNTYTYSLNHDQVENIPVQQNGNPNLIEQSTLVFDGTYFIDVPITADHNFQSVAISLYIQAKYDTRPRSVFFHYKSTNNEQSKITEIILEGNYKDLKFTVKFGDGAIFTESCPNDYKTSSVFLGTFVHSFTSGRAGIYFDWEHNHQIDSISGRSLSVPGTVRFGGHQTDTAYGYIGQLSCASMFDIDEDIDPTYYASICNSIVTPPTTAPSLVWPLDDKMQGFEVKTNIVPTYNSLNPPRCLPGPLDLPNNAMAFDGSFLSSISTSVPQTMLLGGEFSLAVFILLDIYNDGDIIYAKSSLHGFLLNVQNGNLYLSQFDHRRTTPCATVTVDVALNPLQWYIVVIQRSMNTTHFVLIGDSWLKVSDQATCQQMPEPSPAVNMDVVLGVMSMEQEGFKGALRCMVLFEFIRPIPVLLDMLNTSCKSQYENNITVEFTNAKKRVSKQAIVSANHQPPAFARHLRSFTSKSLTFCGEAHVLLGFRFNKKKPI
ncbi:uncharacterized protein LOC126816550 isoform X2 [Patella vulgata]|uniref:uncharacterized protein LOC126816550 isoform X2 n=1 Tax=Patella vulgata TaxID=6465 RepID=UPI00217F6107|nr:uncharacterized protein LOC126816550 isoform X2 [Patella vulgata]